MIRVVDHSLASVKGVLVHGPAGIGKTLAVSTVLQRIKARLGNDLTIVKLTPADFVESKDQGKVLKAAFEEVVTCGRPAVLWVEEIDYIAKTKNLFYSFLAELDKCSGERVLVIATTSKLADVDKSLRRGG